MVGTGVAERNLCTCARIEWLRMPEIIQITKGGKRFETHEDKGLVLLRDVCRTDCSGSIYQDTGSGGSIYIAVLFTYAGGLL